MSPDPYGSTVSVVLQLVGGAVVMTVAFVAVDWIVDRVVGLFKRPKRPHLRAAVPAHPRARHLVQEQQASSDLYPNVIPLRSVSRKDTSPAA